jgi:transcriptional regulator with XRE-family HTH domain
VNTNKEQIIALLSQGISAAQVAAAVGVSESYISQLRSDPEISDLITTSGTAKLEAAALFDSSLERAELMALEKIEKNLPFANMGQAMAAFRILNSARKRSDAIATPADQSTNITVNLTLPASAAARYVVNTSNEIVEVEGQTMITATAKSLDNLLASRASGSLTQPKLTTLNRAAGILAQVSPFNNMQPTSRSARRLPLALSADIL